MSRVLMAQLGTTQSRRDLAIALGRIGSNEYLRGNQARACVRYEESLELHRALQAALGTTSSRYEYLWTAQRTASCHLAMSDPNAAREVLQPAETVAIALESDARDDRNFLSTVAAYWERRAETAAHSDPQETSSCAARAASIRTRIAGSTTA